MPDFYVDDLNISPSEFVDACSTSEIEQLIDVLVEDGYINRGAILMPNLSDGLSLNDEFFIEALIKLSQSRHLLTKTEEGIIKSIADKL